MSISNITQLITENRSAQTRVIQILILIGLIAVPFATESYETGLMIELLALALFAVSYDLMYGFSGVLSFGHALPFGLGAYGVGIFLANQEVPLLPTESGGIFLGLLFALLLIVIIMGLTGALALRASGVYFALLTLAFAQLIYIWVFQSTDITGGDNGLLMYPPTILGINLGDTTVLYFVTLVVVVGSYLIIRRLVNSPFGMVLQSIEDNSERAKFLGYNVFRYKLTIYIVSGIFAGMAGVLTALHNSIATASMLHWETTADPVLMTIIGGNGILWGPVLGAVFIFGIEEIVSGALVSLWPLVYGTIFVLFVLAVPQGIAGAIISEKTIRKQVREAVERIIP